MNDRFSCGRGEGRESGLDRLSIEQGDGKQADAAPMAALPAGKLVQQRGAGARKPVGSLFKESERCG
jgi:hypothetical protein